MEFHVRAVTIVHSVLKRNTLVGIPVSLVLDPSESRRSVPVGRGDTFRLPTKRLTLCHFRVLTKANAPFNHRMWPLS